MVDFIFNSPNIAMARKVLIFCYFKIFFMKIYLSFWQKEKKMVYKFVSQLQLAYILYKNNLLQQTQLFSEIHCFDLKF